MNPNMGSVLARSVAYGRPFSCSREKPPAAGSWRWRGGGGASKRLEAGERERDSTAIQGAYLHSRVAELGLGARLLRQAVVHRPLKGLRAAVAH